MVFCENFIGVQRRSRNVRKDLFDRLHVPQTEFELGV